MQNKELKNPMLNELDDDALNNVSGGTDGTSLCPKCGNPLDANNLCNECNLLIPINNWGNERYRGFPLTDE